MPGHFDRIEDLFFAADLFVSFKDGLGSAKRFMKLAIASKVPTLVETSPGNAWWSENVDTVFEFQQRSTNDLAEAVIHLLRTTTRDSKVTPGYSSEVAEKLQFRQTVDQYVSLMKSLVENAGRQN